MAVTADDLDAAVSSVVAGLRPATGLDWSVRAYSLEWDCRRTAEHIGDCLLSFALSLSARREDRFLRLVSNADRTPAPTRLLAAVEVSGRALRAAVRTARPEARAWHPTGRADPEGFAAMGCVEALVHGDDIARGLGLALDPPRDSCARVLTRLFPEATHELAGVDPWTALRWSTGRIALSGLPRRTGWHWHATPPLERRPRGLRPPTGSSVTQTS